MPFALFIVLPFFFANMLETYQVVEIRFSGTFEVHCRIVVFCVASVVRVLVCWVHLSVKVEV